jgi:hypothetical protein
MANVVKAPTAECRRWKLRRSVAGAVSGVTVIAGAASSVVSCPIADAAQARRG